MTTDTKTAIALKWEVAPKPLAEVNENLRREVAKLQHEGQVARAIWNNEGSPVRGTPFALP